MMNERSHSKVRAEHVARKAIVYLRQSSNKQVRENQESQRLQYGLVDRARSLGWQDIEVVDIDLGKSAALGAGQRPGFEKVVSKVALGEVGIVLSREVSRLSRTDRDWCHLMEVCQIFGTLIGDEDQIYDLDQMDDQLVLGIKGTLSVVELKVLKARMESGRQEKARRGELRCQLPTGYVYDLDGRPVKDADLSVREAIDLLFAKFRSFGCVRQLYQWIVDEEIKFPAQRRSGGRLKIEWNVPQLLWVYNVLKNPFYAGAYVYGRRPREAVVVDGKVVKRTGSLREAEDSKVFIPEHHDGYIDWITFKENQRMMRDNRPRKSDDESRTSARTGSALLVGLLRCGQCGRKFHVHYWGGRGTSPRYLCRGESERGGDRCVGFAGVTVERAVIERVLQVVSPMGVDASLLAIESLESEGADQLSSMKRRLQQLEYDATRAFEQYNEVDPRNRLVATELERRWNAKLEECALARAEIDMRSAERRKLDASAFERIRDLGGRFADVWSHAACSPVLKKKIVRTVLEEIVATRFANDIVLVLHWAGGIHTEITVHLPSKESARRTSDEAMQTIRKLAPKYDDKCIAGVLNRSGMTTGSGKRWTRARVQNARYNHSIAGGTSTPPPGVLNLKRAAQRYGVTLYAIERLIDAGLVRNEQTVPLAPLELREDDLESENVQRVLRHFKKTGRLLLDGGSTKNQADLFEQIQGDEDARYRV